MELAQGEFTEIRHRALIAWTLLIFLAGCGKGPDSTVGQNGGDVVVQPGGLAELCFDSGKDDEVVFRFEADGPLQFNLHYHIGDEMFYPVPEHETRAEKGVYLVPKDETYCLMWTNQSALAVRLSAQTEGADNHKWYLSGH